MSDWTPLRWLSGPLDLARRQKSEGFTPAAKEALERWTDPSALGFLKGSPVNCLVVSWASGLPQDAEQQKALQPLIAQGRQAGLEFVGLVDGSADRRAAVTTAREAGLAALAADAAAPGGFPTIHRAERSKADRRATAIMVSDGVWPGVQQSSRAEAGPTGAPWLDSNGWAVQLIRTLAPAKPVWFAYEPPAGRALPVSAYSVAIADVECRGGRWPIALDDKLRNGLAAGDEQAVKTWNRVVNTLKFFRAHGEWPALRPVAVLGVISDFSGPNEFLSTEILNLSSRRLLPFHAIEKSAALQRPLTGLRAIIYADEQPPTEALRNKLLAFVNDGGLLLTGPSWKSPDGVPAADTDPYKRYTIRKLGKGRIAIPRDETQDPWLIAADVHLLMSHRYDLIRFFNAGLLAPHLTAAPDGKKAILHIISFGGDWDVQDVSATLPDRWTRARMWAPGKDTPAPVNILTGESGGVELQLPRLGPYNAIELEK